MNEKFTDLQVLGAGEFEHLNGSLITHLENTYHLLKQWQATEVLCDAGLYHAAYGTAGFDEAVVGLDKRHDIANIIGKEAEEIVYLYCACDRTFVFNAIGQTDSILFKDRFTHETFYLTELQAEQFCLLTVANELELAIDSEDFLLKHGQGLLGLFNKMTPYLSKVANQAVQDILN